jgi:hypothetical protein
MSLKNFCIFFIIPFLFVIINLLPVLSYRGDSIVLMDLNFISLIMFRLFIMYFLFIIFVVSLHDEAVCVLCNLRLVRHMPMTFSCSVTKFSSNEFIYWILLFNLLFTSAFNSLIPSLEKLRVHLVFRSVIECICFTIKKSVTVSYQTDKTDRQKDWRKRS